MTTDFESVSHPKDAPAQRHVPLGARHILATWWPLAASWMLMGVEGPAISAVVARLAEPKINLAAYGGVVFPLSLLVEGPIIMMLAASTALCRDRPSFVKLRRFMNRLSLALTLVHVLMAATPLYDVMVRHIIHAPEEIVGPARLGLLIMIPWTWAIAYRRFHQGVLIRFGHSLKVGLGTGVRLCADAAVLVAGFVWGLPGVIVASCALIAGVLSEALYVYLAVRPTLKNELKPADPATTPLTTRAMLDFYIPLSLTQLLLLISSPLGSAAMSRMPLALESLAAWPVVNGVGYIARGLGGAYNEVVVALIERRGSTFPLRRFAGMIAVASSAVLVLLLIPPVARWVFASVFDLADPLPHMCWMSLLILLPLPAASVAQSYFQGVVLHSRRTRSITESVAIFLGVAALGLVVGIHIGTLTGLYVAILAFTAGELLRTGWLWLRSRPARRGLRERDTLR
jgi:hypothetical protein